MVGRTAAHRLNYSVNHKRIPMYTYICTYPSSCWGNDFFFFVLFCLLCCFVYCLLFTVYNYVSFRLFCHLLFVSARRVGNVSMVHTVLYCTVLYVMYVCR